MIKRIITTIAVLTLSTVFTISSTPLPSKHFSQQYRKSAPTQSQYKVVKRKLVQSVNEYINSNYPQSKLSGEAIVRLCVKHDFDICFALAQAEIESHLGTKGVAARTNSPWNVGAHNGRTAEQMKTRGFGYTHPNHSIEPYIRLVKDNYLGNKKTFNNLMCRYVSLGGKRYASDPNYERKLANKYKDICSGTKINNLQHKLKRVM